MTMEMKLAEEGLLGPNGRSAAALASRLSEVKWFSSPWIPDHRAAAEERVRAFGLGFGLHSYQVRWLSRDELPDFVANISLTDSPLWHELYGLPEQIKVKAASQGLTEQLSFAVDVLPERVFHPAFDGAFSAFQAYGQPVVSHAVNTALFVSGLAAGIEMTAAADEDNPFLPLIAVFESGYWPLGLFDNEFYMV
jgi:hypothetical protein